MPDAAPDLLREDAHDATATPFPILAGAPEPPPPSATAESPRKRDSRPPLDGGAVDQARQWLTEPAGILGENGGLAVILGLGSALGLAFAVLGLWMWQTRRE